MRMQSRRGLIEFHGWLRWRTFRHLMITLLLHFVSRSDFFYIVVCTMPLIYYRTDVLYRLFQNQDPRDYFHSQQLKTSDDTRAGTEQLRCSLSSEEAYGSFMGSVSEIMAVGLSDPIVRPEVAVMVIISLFCASLRILEIILLIPKNPRKKWYAIIYMMHN